MIGLHVSAVVGYSRVRYFAIFAEGGYQGIQNDLSLERRQKNLFTLYQAT